MHMIGVYSIVHISSGKLYIGSSLNIKKRWINHKSHLNHNNHVNPHLQAAWNMYGSTVFKFEVIELVDDKSKLVEREQYWMDYYKSYERDKGYNNKPYAENMTGFKHSDKSKKLISEKNSGSNHPMFGKHQSEESKKKNRESQLGIKGNQFGKHRSQLSIEKIRIGLLGKKRPPFSDEWRKNMSESHKGKHHSEETKKKMKENHKSRRKKG